MNAERQIAGLHPAAAVMVDGIVRRPAASVLLHGSNMALVNRTAYEVARRLVCPADCANADCVSCRKVTAGNHADLLIVSPDEKGKIGMEAVHDLQHQLAYGQYESGGRRVVVLESAHTTTLPAQNALLKTIEEPPADTTILVTATAPSRLLATIVSRCRPVFIPSVADVVNDQDPAVARLHTGSLLDRLVAARDVADGGVVADDVVRGLHMLTRSGDGAPQSLAGRLDAVLRLGKRLNANVTPRAALEAYVLEVAAC